MEFGHDYQEELLLKFGDKKWWSQCGDIVRSDCFTPPYSDVAEPLLTKLHHGRHVSVAQIRQMCRKEGIKLNGIGNGDYDLDRKELSDYRKHVILREAMTKANVYIEQGKYDKVSTIFTESRMRFPGSTLGSTRDALHDPGDPPERENVIPTGLPTLDSALFGGLGAGEVGIICAPSGGGKSQFLIWLAVHALRKGKKVALVSLEDQMWDVEARIRRCVGQTTETPTKRKWKNIQKKMPKKGSLIIQCFPSLSASIRDIDTMLPGDVDVLILDYADEVRRPSGAIGMEYHDLGVIYSEMQQLGSLRNIPVWSASQVNRSGYNFDKDNPTNLHQMSDSMKKGHKAGVVFTLNFGSADIKIEEDGTCTATGFVAKNRYGPKNQMIPLTIHFGMSSFEEGTFVA